MSTVKLLNPASTEALMPAFEAFVSELIARYQPRKVIWFGSRARGEGDGWSDFDLLIMMDDCPDPLAVAVDISGKMWPGFAVDLIVRDTADTMSRLEDGDWFICEAFETGRVLHG